MKRKDVQERRVAWNFNNLSSHTDPSEILEAFIILRFSGWRFVQPRKYLLVAHSHSLTKRVHEIPKRETRFRNRASLVSRPKRARTHVTTGNIL